MPDDILEAKAKGFAEELAQTAHRLRVVIVFERVSYVERVIDHRRGAEQDVLPHEGS